MRIIRMFRKKHKKRKTISKWSDQDRQDFADRNILKSYKIPSKKKLPPNKSEWNYDDN